MNDTVIFISYLFPFGGLKVALVGQLLHVKARVLVLLVLLDIRIVIRHF